MNWPFSIQVGLLVGFLGIILPVFIRVVSSPLTLVLISPFFILFVTLLCLVSHVIAGYFLDIRRRPSRRGLLANAARPLAFTTPAAWQALLTRSQWSVKPPQTMPRLRPELPVVSDALNEIMTMIVRDFVLPWYQEISSSPSFPTAVSSVLHESIGRVLERAAAIDLPALVAKRILPKVTAHIEQFRQSEVALRGAKLERSLTHSEELDLLLASRYSIKGGGKLHPAIDNLSSTFTKQTEETHLRDLLEKVLPFVLPEPESRSNAIKIVVREIAACSVLYPVMDLLADPDFWNRAIDEVAGAAIHQQKMISKVRNILEAQSPRHQQRAASTAIAPPIAETITIRTDIRQFESFLRSINRCSSLLDARRLKNDVVGEIRRTRMLLANHEKDDWINGEKTEDVVAFLDRLYTAKRKVEERIVLLGGEDESSSTPDLVQPRRTLVDETTPRLTLRDVLRNPSSLSYLMEFMDRRQRSLPVQFWLTVESFKNPLESVESGESGDEDEPVDIQDQVSLSNVKEDICMINDLYFSGSPLPPALSSISKKHVDNIRMFAGGEMDSSTATQTRVRRSVMLAQRQVEHDMEHDFEEFERSELWFRVVEDSGQRQQQQAAATVTRVGPKAASRPASPPTSTHKQIRGAAPQFLPRSESSPHLAASPLRPENGRSNGSFTSFPRASSSNIDLLMGPPVDDALGTPRAPLFDDPDESQPQNADEAQRMEAIQAALTDIMAHEKQQSERGDHDPIDELTHGSSLFDDGEQDNDNDNDHEGEDGDERGGELGSDDHTVQLAAPGDLQLSYEIARLGNKISDLESQDIMLDTLIKKAELTGDHQELRLLQKSKSSMSRELRELQFQKAQYEQQESANRLLSDRTKVEIVSSTSGEEGGKSVVRYLIQVQQLASDGTFSSGWVVARRYNEFLNMHNRLREKYVLVKGLDFPGKRLVTALSGSFVDTRRTALEKYMQNLIAIPVACESDDLRAFLSRESPFIASEAPSRPAKGPTPFSGSGIVRTVYKSVAESIDDMFFGPSMLDVMILRLTRQAAEFAGVVGSAVNDEDLVAQAIKAFGKFTSEDTLMHISDDLKPLEGETSTSTFSAPICDLILAVFELNKQNNWLRRQAIVIILQQVLGGTIERKIRDNVRTFFEESRIMRFVNMFRDALWPGGQPKPSYVARTSEEKTRTRDEANRKLSALVPDLAANMIGRSNARRGARRIFAVLQNRRLNQHIAYTIVDEVFAALFPEAAIAISNP
ncbi:hypothetical protein FIBSPDRAFT_855816 [Athelia psychrophila]|uniref:PhoX domain-containing protein n=1 Tax=Athelia psychrophila TaxID=1759441 RepID=A0A166NQK2_9AGAM|nr:hypothetical protein FIBSPDRAFT_855816 [Fibularhizoctonia sp. CBS 109695]